MKLSCYLAAVYSEVTEDGLDAVDEGNLAELLVVSATNEDTFLSGTCKRRSPACTRWTSMPTRPSGSSTRYEPTISSAAPAG